jgi:hypothetical protein
MPFYHFRTLVFIVMESDSLSLHYRKFFVELTDINVTGPSELFLYVAPGFISVSVIGF